jgi:hypothetical protein
LEKTINFSFTWARAGKVIRARLVPSSGIPVGHHQLKSCAKRVSKPKFTKRRGLGNTKGSAAC